eukprot:Pgem_evm1s12216
MMMNNSVLVFATIAAATTQTMASPFWCKDIPPADQVYNPFCQGTSGSPLWCKFISERRQQYIPQCTSSETTSTEVAAGTATAVTTTTRTKTKRSTGINTSTNNSTSFPKWCLNIPPKNRDYHWQCREANDSGEQPAWCYFVPEHRKSFVPQCDKASGEVTSTASVVETTTPTLTTTSHSSSIAKTIEQRLINKRSNLSEYES